MGYSSSGGTKGLGVFNNTPATVSDLNQLVTLIARVGNYRGPITESARDAITGAALYEGLTVYNLDKDTLEVYSGTGWVVIYEDTGWVTVTPVGTGFTPTGSGIKFRRKNGVVHFTVSADNASWGSGNWSLAPIPVGFRPASTFHFASSYADTLHEVQFTAAGSVVITTAGTGGIRVSGSYPVG